MPLYAEGLTANRAGFEKPFRRSRERAVTVAAVLVPVCSNRTTSSLRAVSRSATAESTSMSRRIASNALGQRRAFRQHHRNRLSDITDLAVRDDRLLELLESGNGSWRMGIVGTGSPISAAVMTARTPGRPRAAETSIDRMCRCATELRRITAYRIPAVVRSSTNCPRPSADPRCARPGCRQRSSLFVFWSVSCISDPCRHVQGPRVPIRTRERGHTRGDRQRLCDRLGPESRRRYRPRKAAQSAFFFLVSRAPS